MTVHALSGTAQFSTAEEASGALFTVAEARAFDNAQLTSESDYTTAAIIDKEAEIRQWFTQVCGVDFVPTNHTETHDGDGTDTLILDYPEVTSVTSITIDGTALDAAYVDETDYSSGIAVNHDGRIVRRSGTFTAGHQNVTVAYVAGHTAIPDLVKRAALQVCVEELVTNNVPWQADGMDDGGTSYSFARADGFNNNWHKLPDVAKALRLYTRRLPGIA